MSDAFAFAIDKREQVGHAWEFPGYQTERKTLESGDYSVCGFEHRIAVERKTASDLIGTLTFGRERFERELERLKSFDRAIIIVEAELDDIIEWRYRSSVSPKCLVGSFGSFFGRYGIATVFAGNRRNAEILCTSFLVKAAKHLQPRQVA